MQPAAAQQAAAQLLRRARLWWERSAWWAPMAAARVAVCLYFFNHGATHLYDHWWYWGVISFPVTALPMAVCAALVALNVRVRVFAVPLVLLALLEALEIVSDRLYQWLWMGRPWYVNELMMKKLSMLGCALMLVIGDPAFQQRAHLAQRALSGILMGDAAREGSDVDAARRSRRAAATSTAMSAALLAVRLLIAGLFLVVGWGEVSRQLYTAREHLRPPGDGHDQLWMKVLQFALALPFTVGFKTEISALLLSVALLVEAIVFWRFWEALLGIGYELHARDHFCVNIGVAGGLFLLRSFGPGKYSVDELISKKAD
eukprot:m51a1_g9201 hypothetical protein (316) ;mRNA; r:109972-111048